MESELFRIRQWFSETFIDTGMHTNYSSKDLKGSKILWNVWLYIRTSLKTLSCLKNLVENLNANQDDSALEK